MSRISLRSERSGCAGAAARAADTTSRKRAASLFTLGPVGRGWRARSRQTFSPARAPPHHWIPLELMPRPLIALGLVNCHNVICRKRDDVRYARESLNG